MYEDNCFDVERKIQEEKIIQNIKIYSNGLANFGKRTKLQAHALRTIATAVNGNNLSVEKVSKMVGISYRMGKDGKKGRKVFDDIVRYESSKLHDDGKNDVTSNADQVDGASDDADQVDVADGDLLNINHSDDTDVDGASDYAASLESDGESSDDASEDSAEFELNINEDDVLNEELDFALNEMQHKILMKENKARDNPFYPLLSGKARKVHKHKFDGSAIVEYCHDDWFNRIDTSILGHDDFIIVKRGPKDFTHECRRVAQFVGIEAVEMFNKSSYGQMFTVANTRSFPKKVFNATTGKIDTVEEVIRPVCSRRMFQRHKCACVLESPKQRDTADSALRQLDFMVIAMSNLLKYNSFVKSTVLTTNIDQKFLTAFRSRKSFTDYFFASCGFLECPGISITGDGVTMVEDRNALMLKLQENASKNDERKQKLGNNLGSKISEGPSQKVKRVGSIKGHSAGGLFSCWKRNCALRTCTSCSFDSRVLIVGCPVIEAMKANGVLVKVKSFVDQRRPGGGFQSEVEILYLKADDFFHHFETAFNKYALHQWNNIMSSQSRRHLFHNLPSLISVNDESASFIDNVFALPPSNQESVNPVSHHLLPILPIVELSPIHPIIDLDANIEFIAPNTHILMPALIVPANDIGDNGNQNAYSSTYPILHGQLKSRFRKSLYGEISEFHPIFRAGDIIISADFAAVYDHHPQDNLNQAILLHSGQFVVIVTFAEMIGNVRVVRNIAFHFWLRLG